MSARSRDASSKSFRRSVSNRSEELQKIVKRTDEGVVDSRKVHDLYSVRAFSQTPLEVSKRPQLLACFPESTSTS